MNGKFASTVLAAAATMAAIITFAFDCRADTMDVPPVDEKAIAERLLEMAKPDMGERAIILYDPSYLPGITNRLQKGLEDRGIMTFVLTAEPQEIVDTYAGTPEREKRENQFIAALRPLFQSSDIFYWMPMRAYAGDLRWERLVEQSRIRSIHFHWLLPLPGSRDAAAIEADSRAMERRILKVDPVKHRRSQDSLAAALRGATLTITSPRGTHLELWVPDNQWFHFGDGDASRARAATARSIRDREIELPVGMFNFVPPARGVQGRISEEGVVTGAAGAVLTLNEGRVTDISAREGADAIRNEFRRIGPEGDKIATIWINTNPLSPSASVSIELGSNWENGGTNLAQGARRIVVGIPDATLTAGGRVLVDRGRPSWD